MVTNIVIMFHVFLCICVPRQYKEMVEIKRTSIGLTRSDVFIFCLYYLTFFADSTNSGDNMYTIMKPVPGGPGGGGMGPGVSSSLCLAVF